MNIGNIEATIVIIGLICSATIFIISKILSRAKHEQEQDTKIKRLYNGRDECIMRRDVATKNLLLRIETLEQKDRQTELTLVSIKEKMESLTQDHEKTQLMIQRLEDHQQQTFVQLIETMKAMGKIDHN